MRMIVAAAALMGTVLVAGCKEDQAACTPEDAQKKATEMMAKIQDLATSNPEKLVAMGQKAQELQGELMNAQNDPAKACAAVDELMKAME